jgi:hypothetical protein
MLLVKRAIAGAERSTVYGEFSTWAVKEASMVVKASQLCQPQLSHTAIEMILALSPAISCFGGIGEVKCVHLKLTEGRSKNMEFKLLETTYIQLASMKLQ